MTVSDLLPARLQHLSTLPSAFAAALDILGASSYSKLTTISQLQRLWLSQSQAHARTALGHSSGSTAMGEALEEQAGGRSSELRQCLRLLADAGDSPGKAITAQLQLHQEGISALERLEAVACWQTEGVGTGAGVAAALAGLAAVRREREALQGHLDMLQQRVDEVRQWLQQEGDEALTAAQAAGLLLQLFQGNTR